MDDGNQDGHAQIRIDERARRLMTLVEVGGPTEPKIDSSIVRFIGQIASLQLFGLADMASAIFTGELTCLQGAKRPNEPPGLRSTFGNLKPNHVQRRPSQRLLARSKGPRVLLGKKLFRSDCRSVTRGNHAD
jgi:hypothetical protein